MSRVWRVILAMLLFVAVPLAGGGAHAHVLMIAGEQGPAHRETLAALRASLAPQLPAAEIVTADTGHVTAAQLAGSRVIVTVGTEAAQFVAEQAPRQPVLHTLLPRDAYERLPPAPAGGRRSAIFLDQPVQRQIALLVEALPEWHQLALLAGPGSRGLAARLAAAGRERQLTVTVENIASDREIYPALQRLLAERKVLLALPDSAIFNSYTIQNILLTSYRQRSPLVGFSPAYVRAGALLGLYATPTQIGEQAGEAVRAVLAGGGLPPPQASRRFEIGVNENVARSLGITLEPAEAIAARMIQKEAGQ